MSARDIVDRNLGDALKTLMATTPFDRIKIEQICDEAGISRRSFYRHFTDKYALMNWIFQTEYLDKSRAAHFTSISSYFPSLCDYLYENKAFYINALSVEGQNSLVLYISDRVEKFVNAKNQMSFYSRNTKTTYFEHITHYVVSVIINWLNGDPDMSPEDFARRLEHIEKVLNSDLLEAKQSTNTI